MGGGSNGGGGGGGGLLQEFSLINTYYEYTMRRQKSTMWDVGGGLSLREDLYS